MVNYIPEEGDEGDIVILNLDPQNGYEQKGRKLAIIVSNKKHLINILVLHLHAP